MVSSTPFAQKRRAQAHYKAQEPHVVAMEQRAQSQSLADYSLDIFQHLSELEQGSLVQPQLIDSQPEITVAMRPVLFDFLLDVHSRLKLTHASFFLTVSIIDRYCSLRVVRKDHFQLLGLTALWIAAKFTDAKHRVPTLAFLRATCCNCYSQALFLEMECHILKSLSWEVDAPTQGSYIDLILLEKFENKQISARSQGKLQHMANYIAHVLQFHHKCTFAYAVSQIALASIIISTHALALHEEKIYASCDIAQGSSMGTLVATVLTILADAPVYAAVKTKFHQNKGDQPLLVQLVHSYSHEHARRQRVYTPQSPFYQFQTPPVSRSSSDADSVFSSRGSLSSFTTPPSSSAASPVEQMKNSQHNLLRPQQRPQFGGTLQRKRSRSFD